MDKTRRLIEAAKEAREAINSILRVRCELSIAEAKGARNSLDDALAALSSEPEPGELEAKEKWVMARADQYYSEKQQETHSLHDLLDQAWDAALVNASKEIRRLREAALRSQPRDEVRVPMKLFDAICDDLSLSTQSAITEEMSHEIIWKVRHQLTEIRQEKSE